MNISDTIRKVRLWGIKGVIDHFRYRDKDKDIADFFLANAKLPCDDPDKNRGITLIAQFSTRISVSKTMRDLAFSLKDAGIPFQTFDYGDGTVPAEDIAPILTPRDDFRINRYDHVIEMLSSPLPDGIVPHRGRIMFWEFEHGLNKAYPIFKERKGDVIGMSDFNADYFAKELAGIRKTHKLLYPLRTESKNVASKDLARQRFGFSRGDFIVFYNFSLDSGYCRKNPMAAIKSFGMALGTVDNAKLVFKISHAKGHEDRLDEFISYASEHGFRDRLAIIQDYLTQRDLFSLTNACDIYLSTHRSEGFGIGMAEAMSLGKAVVATDYSGNLEFCKPDNAVLIPAKLVPISPAEYEHPWYRVAEKWAEPDTAAAADALRKLYDDPALRAKLGQNAQRFIEEHFSIENFRKSVEDYLRITRA